MGRDCCASSSQRNDDAKSKKEEQLQMPVMVLEAATKGNRGDLIRLLELEESLYHSKVAKKITVYNKNLQSVTHFGDTVLHVLVTNKHNELASVIFEKDRSLLKVKNKMLETPLHSAARVGNKEVVTKLIELAPSEVKDVLREKNCHGETALHEAAKHGHEDVACELMQFNTELAYEIDNKGLSPLYIATDGGYTPLVKAILQKNASSAYIPDSNGLYPIHVVACRGNAELVEHFVKKYPDSAELMDRHGRNIFHIAAEENKKEVFDKVFPLRALDNRRVSEMVAGMINARDYEGNTPFHIAAMKGNRAVMMLIWMRTKIPNNVDSLKGFMIGVLKPICFGENKNRHVEGVKNNKGLTPFDLSVIQVKQTSKDVEIFTEAEIRMYIKSNGRNFTYQWFHYLDESVENKVERTQVIGLGSVLITTVAFAAAFTLPGGLNQENGAPILGRKYIFKAFIIANNFAFIQAFISLLTLISSTYFGNMGLDFATQMFETAASFMVLAFGFGSYVMFALVSKPIAIAILVLSLLLALPTRILIVGGGQVFYGWFQRSCLGEKLITFVLHFLPLLLVFCLPIL